MFDNKWIENARKITNQESWVYDVILGLDTKGGTYLDTLRNWYGGFPGTNKQKKPLQQRIESFINVDHLGGVNELAWWKFLKNSNFVVEPVPTTTSPRPDLKVRAPVEFFVEVTTINVSSDEATQFCKNGAVRLDHEKTLRRVLLKSSNDKKEQILFSSQQGRPSCLVLFDYTTWSGFSTQINRYVANYLLEQGGFGELPIELSAIVYVERKVIDGRIGLSCDRSSVYYNPNAKYKLAPGTFAGLRQYSCDMMEVEPECKDPWIWL